MNIVAHCSDSTFGNAILIDSWHRDRGFKEIGYHAVGLNGKLRSSIYNKFFDGYIESGRPFDDDNTIDPFEMGAHTKGKNDWLGYCFIGKSGQFTEKQLTSFEKWCFAMKEQFGNVVVSQHSDHDPKKPYCAGLPQSYIDKLNCKLQMP